MDYESGIKTIQFYMKLPSDPYKTYWITTEIHRNTSAAIMVLIFLHDAILYFWITEYYFCLLQSTEIGLPSNESPLHGEQEYI